MLPNKYLNIALGIIAFFVVANVILLDFFFVSQRSTVIDLQTRILQIGDNIKTLGGVISNANPAAPVAQTPGTAVGVPTEQLLTGGNTCPQSCVTLINASKSTSTIAPVVQQTSVVHGGEYFVPMGSGSVLSTEATSSNWKTIDGAQATFDAANYGTIKAAYFETFAHVDTNGEVHTRLLDVTTPAIFWSTDKSTNQTTSTFLSTPIVLTPGNKTYKVQMYSSLSTGILDQARIRIVVQ